MAATIEQRDRLIERLELGDTRIREAQAAGEDVGSWEDFWIDLLHEYEQVCRDLGQAAYPDECTERRSG